MTTEERIKTWQLHDSQRGAFGYALYKEMSKNTNIVLITFDLGYKLFDAIKEDMPEQFINVGASEVAGMCVAVGLALSGKIPVVYSITPFLLCRPYEVIRDYVNREELPVKLIGSGRDDDYKHDGFTHDASDTKKILEAFGNVIEYWPTSKDDVSRIVEEVIYNNKPSFVSLKR